MPRFSVFLARRRARLLDGEFSLIDKKPKSQGIPAAIGVSENLNGLEVLNARGASGDATFNVTRQTTQN